jgi:hypothetical protein
MNNQNVKQNLFKFMAVAAVISSTVLLQAQSSQAIPLDGILDSAGKSFVQNLFGIPAEKPAEPQQPAAETENSNAPAPEANSFSGGAIFNDVDNK